MDKVGDGEGKSPNLEISQKMITYKRNNFYSIPSIKMLKFKYLGKRNNISLMMLNILII